MCFPFATIVTAAFESISEFENLTMDNRERKKKLMPSGGIVSTGALQYQLRHRRERLSLTQFLF
jgi:hypothetical protein